jgi:hypothetical protein
MASNRVRGLFLEGLVIVVSVLVAFGVDAWWDGRQEDRVREALITGLRSDFALARADLTRVTAEHARGYVAAEALLQLTLSGAARESTPVLVDSLFLTAIAVGTFDPPTGTLNALLASGDLALLDSPELLLELTAWPGRVADLEREQAATRAVTFEVWNLVGEMGVQMATSWTPVMETTFPAAPSGLRAIVDDPAITQRLWLVWRLLTNTQSQHRTLDSSLTRIEDLLEMEASS